MKYKLVSGNTVSELEKYVQMYLDDGWRPVGAPIFTPGQYYQAVTLEEKPAREVGTEMYREMAEDKMARKAREDGSV